MSYKNLLFAFFISLLIFDNSPLSGQDSIPLDFCINREELKLFNEINNYRKVMNLPEISLSKSLCFVAKQHVIDLVTNKPDTNTCNFHSWSNKGTWEACCYERDIKDKKCMSSKPSELTTYPGMGYEIVYWENRNVMANTVFEQWRETKASKSVILNMNEWEEYSWQSIGIAIKDGFASTWFGEEIESAMEIHICNSTETYKIEPAKEAVDSLIISTAKDRYYLIYGVFTEMEDAKKAVALYQAEGFKNTKIIVKDDKIRISLSDHSTNDGAHNAKKMLPTKYKDAWVMTY
ncbi:MAG: hypothetical protein DRJ05_15535 [Bacteroidetes bacterium]|nr:MAG: hypothetical protein DRJ05_15535 [Bacteroidota bacterium]